MRFGKRQAEEANNPADKMDRRLARFDLYSRFPVEHPEKAQYGKWSLVLVIIVTIFNPFVAVGIHAAGSYRRLRSITGRPRKEVAVDYLVLGVTIYFIAMPFLWVMGEIGRAQEYQKALEEMQEKLREQYRMSDPETRTYEAFLSPGFQEPDT
jgi:hypothetical protein